MTVWTGIDAHTKETAEQLAKLGYYAFVADTYVEKNYSKTPVDADKLAGNYKKITKLINIESIWLRACLNLFEKKP